MSPLCVAVFQGTWSVFSHTEINSAANCAAASGGSSSSSELQHRADKADQAGHIVRSLSLIYLCALCYYIEIWLHLSRTTGTILMCHISIKLKMSPGTFQSFCVLCWARSFLTVTSVSLSVHWIGQVSSIDFPFPLGTIKTVNEPLRCVLDQSVTHAVLSCLLWSF